MFLKVTTDAYTTDGADGLAGEDSERLRSLRSATKKNLQAAEEGRRQKEEF